MPTTNIYPPRLSDRSLRRLFAVSAAKASRVAFCRWLESWLGREMTRRRVLEMIESGSADEGAAPPEVEIPAYPELTNFELSRAFDQLDKFAKILGGQDTDYSMLAMLATLEEEMLALTQFRLETTPDAG